MAAAKLLISMKQNFYSVALNISLGEALIDTEFHKQISTDIITVTKPVKLVQILLLYI
jgi:hypothetical protein